MSNNKGVVHRCQSLLVLMRRMRLLLEKWIVNEIVNLKIFTNSNKTHLLTDSNQIKKKNKDHHNPNSNHKRKEWVSLTSKINKKRLRLRNIRIYVNIVKSKMRKQRNLKILNIIRIN